VVHAAVAAIGAAGWAAVVEEFVALPASAGSGF
jgi:hypothetical protein